MPFNFRHLLAAASTSLLVASSAWVQLVPPSEIVLPAEPSRSTDSLSDALQEVLDETDKIKRRKTPQEERLLQEMRTRPSVLDWRRYGDTLYLWNEWKLHPNGVRTTRTRRSSASWDGQGVEVDCRLLLITNSSSVFFGFGPTKPLPTRRPDPIWKEPSGPEAEMVASLCANVRR